MPKPKGSPKTMGSGETVQRPDEETAVLSQYFREVTALLAEPVERGEGVQVVYRCGYQACRSFFIGYYGRPGQAALLSVKPTKPKTSHGPFRTFH
jgi:hypothetical protein